MAELQAQLAAAKEELSKAAERLEGAEKEKGGIAGKLRSGESQRSDELDKARNELATAADTKNAAVSCAGIASEAAEVSARDVEQLKLECEKKNEVEVKTAQLQNTIKVLRADIAAAKKAELDADARAGKWKQKVETLEIELEEADRAARSAVSELDAKCAENSLLRCAITLLEDELAARKAELDGCRQRVAAAQGDMLDMTMEIEALKSRIDIVTAEKMEPESAMESTAVQTAELKPKNDDGAAQENVGDGGAASVADQKKPLLRKLGRLLRKRATL